jgi:hypothetical protein
MNYIYFPYRLDQQEMSDLLLDSEADLLIDCLEQKRKALSQQGQVSKAMRKTVCKTVLTHGENVPLSRVQYNPEAPNYQGHSVVLQPSVKPLKILEHDNDATLYVIAHGSPQAVGTHDDRVVLTAELLAGRLIADGLPRNIKQIKLYICKSGVEDSGFLFARDLCKALCHEHCGDQLIVDGYLGNVSPDPSGQHRLKVEGKRGQDAKRSFTGRGGQECVKVPGHGTWIIQ